MRSINKSVSNKVGLILLLSFTLLNEQGVAQNKNFVIFNALMYKNTPDLQSRGLSKIFVIYDDSLLIKDNKSPYDLNKRTLSLTKLTKQANKTQIDSNIPICLDVESWPLDEVNLLTSKQKYVDVLTQFKKLNPNSKVGYYNLMPYADTYLYESNRVKFKQKEWVKKWMDVNDNLKPIAFQEDISFPSFYTRTTDKELWLNIVKTQIAKIKNIRKNIPIYAFIWPQYYNAHDASINNKSIDAETWMFELESLYSLCDGVVIWGPPTDNNRKTIYWNENDAWWKATQEFIKKHNIK